jgi:hypothetical protein
MRLKDGDQASSGKGLPSRGQGSSQLRWMVSVIIYYRDTGELAQALEPATYALKLTERSRR